MIDIDPLANLALGIFVVIGLIVVLRFNAFIALIVAAAIVSLLAPGEPAQRITRVAEAFGDTAGKIGIVIGLAAVIGQCLMVSGAADRIVQAFLKLLGQKRGNVALASSGFVLSAPVFFDTVFYLLIPLARSMHRQTKVDYLKYVLAIGAGAVATHTLVPPTPGPLIMANSLGVDLGMMILMGAAIAIPATMVGLAYGRWMQKVMPVPMRPLSGDASQTERDFPTPEKLPPLSLALMPIVLPVLLISASTVVSTTVNAVEQEPQLLETSAFARTMTSETAINTTSILGNPNLALLLATGVAMGLVWRQRKPGKDAMAKLVETSLMSGGLIILITAAGGAFGAMLKAAQVGDAVKELFAGQEQAGGMLMLILAFVIASLMKIAQGSGTVAMITASGMIAAMIGADPLPYHPVYLAAAVGCGSMVCSWMNDSGFWIVAKMGGLTEVEALKSWTTMLAIMGFAGLTVTIVLANILPLAG